MRAPVPMWKQLGLSAALVAVAAGLWFGQDQLRGWLGLAGEPQAERRARPENAGVPVIVSPVALARDDLMVEMVGTGRAQRSVTLRTESEGKVAEIALAAGRRFAEGEVLLRLDAAEQRLALELAETRLAEAERVLERYRRLEGSGAATVATLDEVATAAEVARIEVARAREALADRTLRAPFDGVSGLPEVEVGDWIDSGDTVATYDDRSVLLVEFDLPEALLSRVEPEMAVTARSPAYPGRRFEGSVAEIDSRIDPRSRTARVRVALPNENDLLRPGGSFTIRMELPGGRYPMVPELAVQFSRGALHVWRIAGETAERVEVGLVRRRAGSVLIEGPLQEGDLVVIEGTQRLGPGKPVEIISGGAGGTT